MIAINYSNLRDNMKECFDELADTYETMIVTRKEENMIIMSESSYNSLMETIYLLDNENNYKHLMKSIDQHKSSLTKKHNLIEKND